MPLRPKIRFSGEYTLTNPALAASIEGVRIDTGLFRAAGTNDAILKEAARRLRVTPGRPDKLR